MSDFQENKSKTGTSADGDQDMMYCSRCGCEIGRYLVVDGEVMVQIGGLVVAEIHGNCAQCGLAFHYSLNARRLERLIRRVKPEWKSDQEMLPEPLPHEKQNYRSKREF